MPMIEIKVPLFNTDGLRKRIVKALDRRGRRNENLLLRTTQYFETVSPTFESEVAKVSGEWQVVTAPLDDEEGFGQIWSYLDQGTAVRYATMPEDFVAGTRPGTFETFPSVGGGPLFISTKVPQEGIEARGWTDLLAEEEQPVFAGEMRDAVRGFLTNWGSKASKIISGQ